MTDKNEHALNGENDTPEALEKRESEIIVGYLQDFGLTNKEAVLFFTLSKMGSATAKEITSTAKFSRLQTYRAIKGLLSSGLVEMSLERPRKYTPLKIEQALSLLGQEAERKILEMEKKTPLLLKQWAIINDLQLNRANYTFRIIQGTKNVSKFKIMLYESAKKEIAAIMKPNEILKCVMEGSDDVFQRLNDNSISVRGLSEVNKLNLDASKRFLEFSKLRHTTHQNILPFTLIDGQEVLICLSRDGKEGTSDSAIWTNHPEMVGLLSGVFEMLWDSSIDGKIRVREVERIKFAD